MRHRFRHKRYRIKLNRILSPGCLGYCNPPKDKKPVLALSVDVPKKRRVEIAIHEALHACLWDLDEKAVRRTAKDIASFLKKLNLTR